MLKYTSTFSPNLAQPGGFPHDFGMQKPRAQSVIRPRTWQLIGTAMVVTVMLGAAGPGDGGMKVDVPDVGPLAARPAPAQRLSFQNTIYRAAPVPDPDAAPPNNFTPPQTEVGPKFMSPRSLFQGDGYAYASSEQGTLDRRKTPAAGLGLSVPVQ
jgi:hypothetical protein